jgi:hypothetical protein
VSLALVPEDGDGFLYIETPPESWRDKATPWVMANVAPLLRGGDAIVPVAGIGGRVAEWLVRRSPVRVVCDSPEFDFAFLRSLLDPWPAGVARDPIRFDSRFLGEDRRELLEEARMAAFSPQSPEHDALADVRALRAMWIAAKALAPSGVPMDSVA